jgi:hypothetical protein
MDPNYHHFSKIFETFKVSEINPMSHVSTYLVMPLVTDDALISHNCSISYCAGDVFFVPCFPITLHSLVDLCHEFIDLLDV